MQLTLEKVSPFMPTLTAAQQARVSAWLPVLQSMLNVRYGDRITTDPVIGNEIVFVSFAADALGRRLLKPGLIDQQSVGPASVRHNTRAHLAVWFLPEELSAMDEFLNGGGARSVRMAAPDAIRYSNLWQE